MLYDLRELTRTTLDVLELLAVICALALFFSRRQAFCLRRCALRCVGVF
jgi:hypothetical protein